MPAVETKQMCGIKTGQSLVAVVYICLVSTAGISLVSAADICPLSTTDICPSSTEYMYSVSTEEGMAAGHRPAAVMFSVETG